MADERELEMNLDAALNEQGSDSFMLDDIKDAEVDDFLDDVAFDNQNVDFANTVSGSKDEGAVGDSVPDEIAQLTSDAPVDFASFDIDDFDAALNSFQAARAGKLPRSVPMPPPPSSQPKSQSKQKAEPKVEAPSATEKSVKKETSAPEKAPVEEALPVEQNFEIQREEHPVSKSVAVQTQSGRSGQFNPSTVDETGFEENSTERQQDILNWYSGKLSDKTYEISPENMPEFLDTDKTIRVLHVTVDSTYGWNVFFDNGVFMSLRDLKEYQERHGEIPCQDGKIIYGSKTTSFERILRVVVYERPRYFSYIAK